MENLILKACFTQQLNQISVTKAIKFMALTCGEEGRGRKQGRLVCSTSMFSVDDGDILHAYKKNNAWRLKESWNFDEFGDIPTHALIHVSTYGGYTRRGCGRYTVESGEAIVLASGYGADGQAGNIGNWDGAILACTPNTVIKVKLSGQGANSTYLHIDTNLDINAISDENWELYCEASNLV